MRRLGMFMLAVAVLALAPTGLLLGATPTISYQGRLSLNGSPIPDGPHSVTFSIWNDPSAGSMIWTEAQSVSVTGGDGLFSTHLGQTEPLFDVLFIAGGYDLYMQITVEGQTLSPRQRLGDAVRAMMSSSVSQVRPGVGSLQMSVANDSTGYSASHQNSAGFITSTLNLAEDVGLLGLRAYEPGGSSDMSTVVSMDSASTRLEIDGDGNGLSDATIWEKVDNSDVVKGAGMDADGDGTVDVGTTIRSEIEVLAAGSASAASSMPKVPRAVIKTFFQPGDKPTQSQITDSVDETGAYCGAIRYHGSDFEGHSISLMPDSAVVNTEVSNPSGSSSSTLRERINSLETILKSYGLLSTSRSSQSLTPESATVTVETQALGSLSRSTLTTHTNTDGVQMDAKAGALNIGLYVSNVSGQSKLSMTGPSTGTPETTIVIDAALKRFGIGVSQPTNPIQHSSGAKLTAGGDWINASDANLKENFHSVDGAQVLAKLDRLPIKRWNYKVEPDDVTHIGPTAQDFQAAFGLGSDDRTISTIDPSGVALVAVQELNRKLDAENRSLRKELDELKRQVEKLAQSK